jgi:hypothetical protein
MNWKRNGGETEIPTVLRNPKVHDHVHNSPYLIPSAWTCSCGVKMMLSSTGWFSVTSRHSTLVEKSTNNVHIWRTQNPREMLEHVRDSLKVNVFYAVSCTKVYGPFFFTRTQRLEEFTTTCLVSGCCLNYKKTVQTSFPSKMELCLTGTWSFEFTWIKICRWLWIGRSTDPNMALTRWPPGSLDLMPCNFFVMGIYQRRVFVPPLPVSVNDLKQHITTAVVSVDEDMLLCVWNELDYLIDICHVTKCSHTEHL